MRAGGSLAHSTPKRGARNRSLGYLRRQRFHHTAGTPEFPTARAAAAAARGVHIAAHVVLTPPPSVGGGTQRYDQPRIGSSAGATRSRPSAAAGKHLMRAANAAKNANPFTLDAAATST
jgi:hypothetical protein